MSFKLPDSVASTLEVYASHIGVSSSQLSVAIALAGAFAGVCVYISSTSPGPSRHGPGPKGIPILGNAADLPKKDDYKVYADWAKKYGMSLNFELVLSSSFANR